ncbi:MAG: hypothetical protein KJZ84_08170 [Bryobacteraceae bacterium]|nr:hypothetical protein [Bryobacteraceae bacterium]
MQVLSIAAMAIICAVSLHGDSARWRQFQSANFDLLTNADATEANAALAHLEAVRLQIACAEPWLGAPPGRVRILAFSSEKEFEPYRSSSQSPAFFASGPEGDLIVLGRLAEDHWPTLAHEYVHAAVRAAGLRLPLWLEEGLAELYSGRPAPPRGAKRRPGRFDLTVLAAERPAAAHLRAAPAGTGFYHQSRQMAHLLRHHPGYTPRWPDLLRNASAGLFSGDLPALLGRTHRQIAADVRRFRKPFPLQPAPIATSVVERPLGLDEHRWTLALALTRLGRDAQALDHLEGIESAEAHALAAKLLLRRNDPRAGARLRRAFELGARDEFALWQLICLEQDNPASTLLLPAFERFVEARPERDDARLILASHYLARGLYVDVRRHLDSLRQVPPEYAAYYQQARRIIGPA